MRVVRPPVILGPLVLLLLAGSPTARAAESGEDAGTVRARAEWFRDRHLDPGGAVPHRARGEALAEVERNLRTGVLGSAAFADSGEDTWTSFGPEEMLRSGASHTGRVTALAVHPSNPDILYVGAAQGGVWKTTDRGLSWTPLTDGELTLAVGSLALDPSDPDTVYVGTGEANDSCGGYFGQGILKSEDGGGTWALLAGNELAGTSVSRVLVDPADPDTVWAANARGRAGFVCTEDPGPLSHGVWKSLDGGLTWSLVLGSGQTGIPTHTFDLVMDPANRNVLYAGVGESGVWKTVDGGASWTRLAGGLPASLGRVDLGIDPSDGQVLYATFENATLSTHLGTYRSTDGGATWTALPPVQPGASCGGVTFDDVCTYEDQLWGICYWALYVEVAPDGTLWLGGLGVWRSPDEGATWLDACPDDGHVDQHAVAFGADGSIWTGNDGGVFLSGDGGATWTTRNRGMVTAQFYPGAALHPGGAGLALGGTQDNGSQLYEGSPSWTQVLIGDGGPNAIDPRDPDRVWYITRQFLAIFKTTDGGATLFPAVDGLTDAGSLVSPTIAPFLMCPSDPDVLIAGSNNVWRTDDGAASWLPNSPDPLAGTWDRLRALAFAPTDASCGTYFAGLDTGAIFRTTSGGAPPGWTEMSAGLPGAGISELAVDPNDANIVYAALTGFGTPHVFRTTNALATEPTWTPVSAGLPDSPADSLLIDPDDSSTLYVGTDVGIFRSLDAGATWEAFMEGHPRVAVYDLAVDPGSGSLVSFTHGRGAFRLGCSADPCPGVGSTLRVAKSASNADLGWLDPGCLDLDRYEIYGSTTYDAAFPAEWELLGTAAVPGFQDPLDSPYNAYQVLTVDRCGNPSGL